MCEYSWTISQKTCHKISHVKRLPNLAHKSVWYRNWCEFNMIVIYELTIHCKSISWHQFTYHIGWCELTNKKEGWKCMLSLFFKKSNFASAHTNIYRIFCFTCSKYKQKLFLQKKSKILTTYKIFVKLLPL